MQRIFIRDRVQKRRWSEGVGLGAKTLKELWMSGRNLDGIWTGIHIHALKLKFELNMQGMWINVMKKIPLWLSYSKGGEVETSLL